MEASNFGIWLLSTSLLLLDVTLPCVDVKENLDLAEGLGIPNTELILDTNSSEGSFIEIPIHCIEAPEVNRESADINGNNEARNKICSEILTKKCKNRKTGNEVTLESLAVRKIIPDECLLPTENNSYIIPLESPNYEGNQECQGCSKAYEKYCDKSYEKKFPEKNIEEIYINDPPPVTDTTIFAEEWKMKQSTDKFMVKVLLPMSEMGKYFTKFDHSVENRELDINNEESLYKALGQVYTLDVSLTCPPKLTCDDICVFDETSNGETILKVTTIPKHNPFCKGQRFISYIRQKQDTVENGTYEFTFKNTNTGHQVTFKQSDTAIIYTFTGSNETQNTYSKEMPQLKDGSRIVKLNYLQTYFSKLQNNFIYVPSVIQVFTETYYAWIELEKKIDEAANLYYDYEIHQLKEPATPFTKTLTLYDRFPSHLDIPFLNGIDRVTFFGQHLQWKNKSIQFYILNYPFPEYFMDYFELLPCYSSPLSFLWEIDNRLILACDKSVKSRIKEILNYIAEVNALIDSTDENNTEAREAMEATFENKTREISPYRFRNEDETVLRMRPFTEYDPIIVQFDGKNVSLVPVKVSKSEIAEDRVNYYYFCYQGNTIKNGDELVTILQPSPRNKMCSLQAIFEPGRITINRDNNNNKTREVGLYIDIETLKSTSTLANKRKPIVANNYLGTKIFDDKTDIVFIKLYKVTRTVHKIIENVWTYTIKPDFLEPIDNKEDLLDLKFYQPYGCPFYGDSVEKAISLKNVIQEVESKLKNEFSDLRMQFSKKMWEFEYLRPVVMFSPFDAKFHGYRGIMSCADGVVWTNIYKEYLLPVEMLTREIAQKRKEDVTVYTFFFSHTVFNLSEGPEQFLVHSNTIGKQQNFLALRDSFLRILEVSDGYIGFITSNNPFAGTEFSKIFSPKNYEFNVNKEKCELWGYEGLNKQHVSNNSDGETTGGGQSGSLVKNISDGLKPEDEDFEKLKQENADSDKSQQKSFTFCFDPSDLMKTKEPSLYQWFTDTFKTKKRRLEYKEITGTDTPEK